MFPIRSLTPQQATGNALATGFSIANSRPQSGVFGRFLQHSVPQGDGIYEILQIMINKNSF